MLAILIAAPVGWWAGQALLNYFAYHTQMRWWHIMLAGLLAAAIALLTVSYQSVKAAMMNPVKSLRSE